jgi:predicted transcriptional regulator
MDELSILTMSIRMNSYSGGGPTPKFSAYHIWKAYEIIRRKGPIGRKALSRELGVGEGSTRTVLDKLLREGSIENTRRDAVLTEIGRKKFQEFEMDVKRVDMGDLTVGAFDCAVQIRGMSHLIALGCDQRDEAVRAGAMGATTLVCKDGELNFPGEDVDVEQVKLKPIYDVFDIQENDVIIIGSGLSYEMAEKGATTAALALGADSNHCWQTGTRIITADTKADDIKCLALAIHELVGRLPVTMRSRNEMGVRCEGGGIVDTEYTGPVLEEALGRNTIVRKVAPDGPFAGVPVIAVPIIRNNEAVAAISVVDISTGPIFKILQRIREDR